MTDIVLDTNAFRIFDSEKCEKSQEIIKKVVNNCDSIYVPQSFDKELRILPLNLLSKPLKELNKGRRKKFQIERIDNESLPSHIEKRLRECGAKPFDIKVVKVAFRRRDKGQVVYLLSNDHHLQKIRKLAEEQGISIRTLKEFEQEYLALST